MLFLPDDDQIRFAWAVAADGMMSLLSSQHRQQWYNNNKIDEWEEEYIYSDIFKWWAFDWMMWQFDSEEQQQQQKPTSTIQPSSRHVNMIDDDRGDPTN